MLMGLTCQVTQEHLHSVNDHIVSFTVDTNYRVIYTINAESPRNTGQTTAGRVQGER